MLEVDVVRLLKDLNCILHSYSIWIFMKRNLNTPHQFEKKLKYFTIDIYLRMQNRSCNIVIAFNLRAELLTNQPFIQFKRISTKCQTSNYSCYLNRQLSTLLLTLISTKKKECLTFESLEFILISDHGNAIYCITLFCL